MDELVELMEKFTQALRHFSDWFLFARKKRGSARSDMIIFNIVCIAGVLFFVGIMAALFINMFG